MTSQEEEQAIDALLKANTPKSLAAKLDARDNLRLHVEEDAKQHPLDEIEMTDEQWGRFAAHMLDGGGVRQDEAMLGDDPSLRDQFHSAVVAGDRKKSLHLLPHLVKSLMVRTGMRRRLAGGVASGPHGAPASLSLSNPIGS